jgi:hypothetical protein
LVAFDLEGEAKADGDPARQSSSPILGTVYSSIPWGNFPDVTRSSL